MREHRLLDRIRFVEKNPNRRITRDPQQMIHSVQDHHPRLLNTRQGSAPIADDFGVPDFTNFKSAFPDSQRGIERNLRQTIQKYEPRLQGIRVVFLPKDEDSMSIMFKITARLVLEDHKEPVSFESQVDSDGYIKVKR